MGAGQSTRDIPDYVYLYINVDKNEHIIVNISVFNTNLQYQLRQYMQENDIINNYQLTKLSEPINPKHDKLIYTGFHTDEVENTKISFHVTKTLDELIEERNRMDQEFI